MTEPGTFLGIVVGLQREVNAIRGVLGAGTRVACAGADPLRAERAAVRMVEDGAGVLLSMGYAGALSPDLPSGSIVLANEVISASGEERYRVASPWIAAVERRLTGGAPVVIGPLVGSDVVLDGPDAKRRLWLRTGCIAVDMESVSVARAANRCGVPFGVIRVIVDDAETVIPGWLAGTVTPEGGTEWSRLMRGVASQPLAVPALVRLARQELRASQVLREAVGRLRGGIPHEAGIP